MTKTLISSIAAITILTSLQAQAENLKIKTTLNDMVFVLPLMEKSDGNFTFEVRANVFLGANRCLAEGVTGQLAVTQTRNRVDIIPMRILPENYSTRHCISMINEPQYQKISTFVSGNRNALKEFLIHEVGIMHKTLNGYEVIAHTKFHQSMIKDPHATFRWLGLRIPGLLILSGDIELGSNPCDAQLSTSFLKQVAKGGESTHIVPTVASFKRNDLICPTNYAPVYEKATLIMQATANFSSLLVDNVDKMDNSVTISTLLGHF